MDIVPKVMDGGFIAMNMPIVKSRESPGRTGKMAHSTKRMRQTPHSAPFPRAWMIVAGSIQEGIMGTSVSRVMRFTTQG